MTAAALPVLPLPAAPVSTTGAASKASAEFIHVSKTYRGLLRRRHDLPALQDVGFVLRPGEVCALLGPNRAGKTTLVKILLSLCQPTSGEVRRLGRPASDRSSLARVGYVHENHAFPRYLDAATLLEYYGALSFLPLAVLRRRVPELLERVGLADRCREPIARFSKGMLQRLGVAQALLTEPELLVLDEPSEGLDLDGRQMLRGVIREVRQRGGSVLLVSHVLAEVASLCDRVVVLAAGRLVHEGPLADLTREPHTQTPRSLETVLQELYARSNSGAGTSR
jgi:ABC-2 type transport system ATP-binding protein